MKRCPECRRDYYDETLLYCLDDGTALLDGTSSGNTATTEIFGRDANSFDENRTELLERDTSEQVSGSSPDRHRGRAGRGSGFLRSRPS